MSSLTKVALSSAALLLVCSVLSAQVQTQSQTPDKQQKPAAHAADFTGVWYPSSVNLFNFIWTDAQGHTLKDLPLTTWGEQKFKEHHPIGGKYTALTSNDPNFACLPPGMPMMYTHAFPMEILEVPGRVVMFFEYGHYVRQIFTDGRGHSNDLGPTWMGDTTGHWEGDTLVTDSSGFNDKTWLDVTGHPHSEDLHIVERIRRTDHDTLMMDLTIDDPKAYTTPLKTQRKYILKPGWNISEFICEDDIGFAKFEKKVGATDKTGAASNVSGSSQSIVGDWKGSATMAVPAAASFSSSSTGAITVTDPAGAVKYQFINLAVSATGTVTGNTRDGTNLLGQLSKDGKQIAGDLVLASGTGHKISLNRP
jgi:hypothetical protein